MKQLKILLLTSLVILFTACGGGGSGGDNPPAETTVPVANAGFDQNVYVGNTVTLDGSNSSNPVTYEWSITSKPTGSNASLSNTIIVNPTFIPDLNGSYIVQLIVNDGILNSTPDSVIITAYSPPNDFTMTLDVNESNTTTNWVTDSNALSDSKATIDTQGDYGICSIDGDTINYLQNVETNETDTCVININNSVGTSKITITIKSLYWKQVSAGGNYSAAIKSDGTLWSWGYNYFGQLGDGTKTNRGLPTQEITKANNWKQVSAGSAHTVAIKNDGTLWAWGFNRFGGLGDGTTVDRVIPTQELRHASDWSKINAGGAHTLAIKTDNTLWACGMNNAGQVGDGTIINRTVLTQESTYTSDWLSVDGGEEHSIALKHDNSLWIWGSNQYGQLGDGTTVNKYVPTQEVTKAYDWKSISTTTYHNVALKINGTIWSWGRNNYGQIGDGTPYNPASNDIKTVITQEITKANDWKSISAGSYHTVAIKNNGTLWSWGNNTSGELGDGTTIPKSVPTQEYTKSNNWNRVSSYAHNLAIKDDSTLWAWGWNYYGQLGDDNTTIKLY